MSTEANKAVARRFIQEVFVQGSGEAVDEIVSQDFVPHSWGAMPPGRESLKQAQKRVSQGLSDVSMTIEDMIAEGDKVAVRLTARGTHRGEFMGMKPTGKSYQISETHIVRIANGQVAEHWRDADMMGMMKQLEGGEGGTGG